MPGHTAFALKCVLSVAAGLALAQTPASAQNARKMTVVAGKDVSGQVLKRLGLPSQDYCWEQCLEEPRCTGTRWGTISSTAAGQCQLLSGELTFHAPAALKTEDGQKIVVIASRKE